MRPPDEHEELVRIIEKALENAATVFSQIVETACRPTGSAVLMRTVRDLPGMIGKLDDPVVAVLLTVNRDLSGFLIIIVPERFVEPLTRSLLGDACADEELVESALAEVGNVVGSAFLNTLADSLDLTVTPTPPQVIHDMAAALLGTLAAYRAMEGHEEFPVIQTQFAREGQPFAAYLLWLPGELQVLGERS